ncbi:MAG: CatB-related O-acetyltransferase [Magnetococcales bacterium]|nr:CatB-related O-acetyltransferase [Magnetococcales bacterium]
MDSDSLFPIIGFKNTVFLKPLIKKSEVANVIAGDYSYYSDFNDPTQFLEKNVLYNFGFSGAKLLIGKFCALAHGVQFIMPDANHSTSGATAYPFAVFGEEWRGKLPITNYPFTHCGDTVIGNDVWIGMDATIMPGVTIGDGAIIGAKSVVSKDVAPYTVVAGNPAKKVKNRFNEETTSLLKSLAWWDWPQDHITVMIPDLVHGNFTALKTYANNNGLLLKFSK